jgi:NAD(P)-dependent dehydrogenase (short-subunit alcohol dehydrogenase family)
MASVLITGTNRGIGLEFVEQFLARGDRVFATCRNPSTEGRLQELAAQHQGLELLQLDLSPAASMAALPAKLAGAALDVLVSNAGVYGSGQSFGELDGGVWADVFHVNAIAPLLLTQLLMDNLRTGRSKKLVYLTSKMGSIADNQGGGSYIYRSSKAALNAAVRSLAIDLKDQGFAVGLLHPGWVRTDMGGTNALIDTNTSVTGLMGVIDHLNPANTGGFFNYDGTIIPW